MDLLEAMDCVDIDDLEVGGVEVDEGQETFVKQAEKNLFIGDPVSEKPSGSPKNVSEKNPLVATINVSDEESTKMPTTEAMMDQETTSHTSSKGANASGETVKASDFVSLGKSEVAKGRSKRPLKTGEGSRATVSRKSPRLAITGATEARTPTVEELLDLLPNENQEAPTPGLNTPDFLASCENLVLTENFPVLLDSPQPSKGKKSSAKGIVIQEKPHLPPKMPSKLHKVTLGNPSSPWLKQEIPTVSLRTTSSQHFSEVDGTTLFTPPWYIRNNHTCSDPKVAREIVLLGQLPKDVVRVQALGNGEFVEEVLRNKALHDASFADLYARYIVAETKVEELTKSLDAREIGGESSQGDANVTILKKKLEDSAGQMSLLKSQVKTLSHVKDLAYAKLKTMEENELALKEQTEAQIQSSKNEIALLSELKEKMKEVNQILTQGESIRYVLNIFGHVYPKLM
jgi:hypothetical protein